MDTQVATNNADAAVMRAQANIDKAKSLYEDVLKRGKPMKRFEIYSEIGQKMECSPYTVMQYLNYAERGLPRQRRAVGAKSVRIIGGVTYWPSPVVAKFLGIKRKALSQWVKLNVGPMWVNFPSSSGREIRMWKEEDVRSWREKMDPIIDKNGKVRYFDTKAHPILAKGIVKEAKIVQKSKSELKRVATQSDVKFDASVIDPDGKIRTLKKASQYMVGFDHNTFLSAFYGYLRGYDFGKKGTIKHHFGADPYAKHGRHNVITFDPADLQHWRLYVWKGLQGIGGNPQMRGDVKPKRARRKGLPSTRHFTKRNCIEQYKDMKRRFGGKLTRSMFWSNAPSRRRFERLWGNWGNFVVAAERSIKVSKEHKKMLRDGRNKMNSGKARKVREMQPSAIAQMPSQMTVRAVTEQDVHDMVRNAIAAERAANAAGLRQPPKPEEKPGLLERVKRWFG